MSCPTCTTTNLPTAIRPSTLRTGLALVLFVALVVFAARASAQAPVQAGAPAAEASKAPIAPVPFSVGEELVFRAKFGVLPAGSAKMRVEGIDTIRGRPAYHVVFAIDGGIPLFRVHDRYESWIDRETLSSLRHHQQISEGRYHRNTTYEIFPDRAEFQKDSGALERSVSNPLDDGSFIYAIRAAGVRVGETRRDDRYFRPDRNPVVLTGLREDTVTVGAGTFPSTVIRPTIKANGIFSENGEAEVWFSSDDRRLPVQLKTKFAKFSLTLSLESVTPAEGAAKQLPGSR
jgi:hypothetical protein